MDNSCTITCPNCGYQSTAEMPTNACQWYYQCPNCQKLLTPLKGDCCVFCSYGNKKCPPKQSENPNSSNCCSQ